MYWGIVSAYRIRVFNVVTNEATGNRHREEKKSSRWHRRFKEQAKACPAPRRNHESAAVEEEINMILLRESRESVMAAIALLPFDFGQPDRSECCSYRNVRESVSVEVGERHCVDS